MESTHNQSNVDMNANANAASQHEEANNREILLEKITNGLFPNDYLDRMLQKKDHFLNIPQLKELTANNDKVKAQQQKFAEDARFDYLVRMQCTMNETFENSSRLHPHGMMEYDYQSIPESRRPGLEHFKMKIRRENYMYLTLHKEIDAMISLFLHAALKDQPADPIKFAGEYFTHHGTTYKDFARLIHEEKERLSKYRDPNCGDDCKDSKEETTIQTTMTAEAPVVNSKAANMAPPVYCVDPIATKVSSVSSANPKESKPVKESAMNSKTESQVSQVSGIKPK